MKRVLETARGMQNRRNEMRLIDADKLDEEIRELSVMITGKPNQITAGNEYKRSISRIIDEQPTAFNKEKVIKKLVELKQKEYNDSDEEPELSDAEEIYDEGRSQGRFEAYQRAIEIVEKGGKERECRD